MRSVLSAASDDPRALPSASPAMRTDPPRYETRTAMLTAFFRSLRLVNPHSSSGSGAPARKVTKASPYR